MSLGGGTSDGLGSRSYLVRQAHCTDKETGPQRQVLQPLALAPVGAHASWEKEGSRSTEEGRMLQARGPPQSKGRTGVRKHIPRRGNVLPKGPAEGGDVAQ